MNLSILRPIVVTLLIVFSSSAAAGLRRERRIDGWRPVHYSVNLTLDEKLSKLTSARAAVTVEILENRLSVIDFDFGRMTITSVRVNGRQVRYEHHPGTLKLNLPTPFQNGARPTVVVEYRGKPEDGLILSRDKDGRPSAVGDNWPNRVHHWIPSLDHPSAKATVTFTVTAPAGSEVVANGQLTSVTTAKSTRTWTFSEGSPIPPYCMIIAVGRFAKLEPEVADLTPLTYYVPLSDKKYAMQGFAPSVPSLKFFRQTVGPYPYDKLALIVGPTRFGGMENAGAIVFSKSLFDPRPREAVSNLFNIRRGIVNLVAHEIAHQWFGNSVTQSTWSDLWLSEGFATYFAGLFIQEVEGEAVFQNYMQEAAQQYLQYAAVNRTPIFDDQTEDLMKLLNANNYQKAAWVLHMLRSRLGDDAFFRGIRAYYNSHKSTLASTEDLRAALERESGADLQPFFKSWIYGSGHPQYELLWTWNKERGLIQFNLKQMQPEPVFSDPLTLKIFTAKSTQEIVLLPKGKELTEELQLEAIPSAIQVDPKNTVLKELNVRQLH